MKIRNLFRPSYLFGRLQNWIYEKCHPDHPWLAPAAIRWLDANMPREGVGFEWGGGRSTLWYARRLASLITIESEDSWFKKLSHQIEQAGLKNITLRLVPIEHPELGTYENDYLVLPANAAAITSLPDASLDFVSVDAWYRPVCARAALPKLKPGGILLIDNTDWRHPPHAHVPPDWPLVHRSRNVMTETSIWRKPD